MTVLNPYAIGNLVTSEAQKPTYRYAINGITPVAAPTDVLVIKGSATTLVKIKYFRVTGLSTAAGQMSAILFRRSTAGTLGSAVLNAITAAKYDINDPAATAVVSYVGTANYTAPGTSAGLLGATKLVFSNTGGVSTPTVFWEFSTRNDKALILRGTSDFICFNMNGDALPTGAALSFDLEIEEELQ